MTSVLAAGFNNVAASYDIAVARVSLTTGLYMMGLGVGSVIMSPTAILFGKRPVYLATSILFIVSSVWCALSPNFPSLILARIFRVSRLGFLKHASFRSHLFAAKNFAVVRAATTTAAGTAATFVTRTTACVAALAGTIAATTTWPNPSAGSITDPIPGTGPGRRRG